MARDAEMTRRMQAAMRALTVNAGGTAEVFARAARQMASFGASIRMAQRKGLIPIRVDSASWTGRGW